MLMTKLLLFATSCYKFLEKHGLKIVKENLLELGFWRIYNPQSYQIKRMCLFIL